MLPFVNNPRAGAALQLARRGWRLRTYWAVAVTSLACGRDALPDAAVPATGAHLLESTPTLRAAAGPETLRANVELFGVELGTIETSACPDTAGRVSTVESHVASAALVNILRRTSGDARTLLYPGSQAPASSEYHFHDGDLLRHYRVAYRAGSYEYSYDNGGLGQQTGRDSVPEGADPHDLHSALGLLRAWRPRLGESAYFYVVLGRRLWRLDVMSVGPEVIQTGGVPQLTHRIDGVAVRLWEPAEIAPRHLSLWLSEDSARVPLRMQTDSSFGEITMALTGRDVTDAACASPVRSASSARRTRVGRAWHSADLPAETAHGGK